MRRQSHLASTWISDAIAELILLLCEKIINTLATRWKTSLLKSIWVYQVYALGMGPNYKLCNPLVSFHVLLKQPISW